jgi:hypothetical protein
MLTPYTWIDLPTALSNIQDRLNDEGVFWSEAELQVYLQEALSILNALTECWKEDFVFPAQGSTWNNLGTMAGSPRLRSVTFADILTEMEYMLLEPAVGTGPWTGTNQFSVEKLQTAVTLRQEEVIQASGCNTVNLAPVPSIPLSRTVTLGDTELEIRRIRFLQLAGTANGTCASGAQTIAVDSTTGLYSGLVVQGAGIASGTVLTGVGAGSVTISLPTTAGLSTTPLTFLQPYYMKRSDIQAFHYFNSDFLQEAGTPSQWSVASEPPLSFDPDVAPAQPGQYDILVLENSILGGILAVPNDWAWVPMYGALADLLSEEPESTDRQRAAYCRKRYEDGVKMMLTSNWFTQATINGAVADTPSLETKDRWQIGWQEDTGAVPCVVTDGIDAFNASPCTALSVGMTVIANAPFLDSTDTYVQVSRDDWDAVLDYVQHVASFKMGGAEFALTVPLLDEFMAYCQRKNKRQLTYGLYTDVLNTQGQKQDVEEPR